MSQRPPLRLVKRNPNLTAREAAAKVGVSLRTAQRWSSEPRENYLARADEKRERVRELRAKGLSIRAIANETGYSVGTVHRYVKENQDA